MWKSMGEVIISGSSTSSSGDGSSSDYTVIVTACVILMMILYMSYTGLIYCYFLLRFLTSIRQHRIVIRGNGVVVTE